MPYFLSVYLCWPVSKLFIRGPYYLLNIAVFNLTTRKGIKFKKMQVKLKQLASGPQY